MIYCALLLGASTIIFMVLFIHSAIANGKLIIQLNELSKTVGPKQKQLEIAANHPDTPDDLAKRMHDGQL